MSEEMNIEERIEQVKKELEEKAEAEKKAIINELQVERQKRQDAEEELKKKEVPSTSTEDPKKIVEQVLNEKEQEEVTRNRKSALEEFKRSTSEFAPDKDIAGIAFSKFEQSLKRFSTSDLKTKEDFKQLYAEAYEFMTRKPAPTKVEFHRGSPQLGSEVKEEDADNLSEREKQLIKDIGWTREKYLKQKASKPAFINSLLARNS